MSYRVKQLGNKYICVGPGNKRLPVFFRSRRAAMNYLISIGGSKGDLGRVDDLKEYLGNSVSISPEVDSSNTLSEIEVNSGNPTEELSQTLSTTEDIAQDTIPKPIPKAKKKANKTKDIK